MIDVSKISDKLVQEFSDAYIQATFVFGVEPLEASAKKQHKIRKWISSLYTEKTNIFSADNSDKEVLSFLKECSELQKLSTNRKKEKFELDFAIMDDLTKFALRKLLQSESLPKIRSIGGDGKIIVEDTCAYRLILTLKNIDAIVQDKEGYYCNNLEMVFKKEEGGFCFCGELEEPIEETITNFAMTFESAEAEIEIYNACNNATLWDNPWDSLSAICFEIAVKFQLPTNCCNAKEKELMLLIEEIAALNYWRWQAEQEQFLFKELKKLTHQYGYNKVEMMLSKLETINPEDAAFDKCVKKLILLLCQKQYAPLWKEVYNEILDSQSEYPNKVDSLCDNELLKSVRSDIQKLMESKGYIGTYPDFVKCGTLNGIHLEHSYNMIYFVGMEKRARYHIHCYESFEGNYLTIEFVCGTAFLKKREVETNVFDCLFDANGRRIFHTVQHCIPLRKEEDAETDDLEMSIAIATKRAECIKLNKAEQKALYGNMIPGWGMFWSIFLIAGGIFSIIMTFAMMLICINFTVVLVSFSSIPEMLKVVPWGWILAIGWIGFGGAMGIVTVLAYRK